jgi:hypothetical protein
MARRVAFEKCMLMQLLGFWSMEEECSIEVEVSPGVLDAVADSG